LDNPSGAEKRLRKSKLQLGHCSARSGLGAKGVSGYVPSMDRDGGFSWRPATTEAVEFDPATDGWHSGRAQCVLVRADGRVIVGTETGGVWVADDEGRSLSLRPTRRSSSAARRAESGSATGAPEPSRSPRRPSRPGRWPACVRRRWRPANGFPAGCTPAVAAPAAPRCRWCCARTTAATSGTCVATTWRPSPA
jgi:hypothetical protein